MRKDAAVRQEITAGYEELHPVPAEQESPQNNPHSLESLEFKYEPDKIPTAPLGKTKIPVV